MQSKDLKSTVKSLFRDLIRSKNSAPEPLPLEFDAEVYLELNPDLKASGADPFEHYSRFGRHEGRPYKKEATESHGDPQSLPVDFEEQEYLRLNKDLTGYKGNLTEHYLKFGVFEFRPYREGVLPVIPAGKKFDKLPDDFHPELYLALNEDLLHAAINPYEHYQHSGHAEGRPVRLPALTACYGRPFEQERPTILVASHEASRTGAPVLAWNICRQLGEAYNLVVLLVGEGTLLSNFQTDAQATYLMPAARHNSGLAKAVIKELHRRHNFEFSLVNSMEAGILCRALTVAGVPSILLVHEFAAYTTPKKRFLDGSVWATATVFSNNLIKEDAIKCFPDNFFEEAPIIPQGQCILPAAIEQGARANPSPTNQSILVNGTKSNQTKRLIIGVGTICFRKGVDLFIETATRMVSQRGMDAYEFVWIGGYPPYSHEYEAFLKDQIERAGLLGVLRIEPETDDLGPIYSRASLLLMTSRLDPLPNVGIDAICGGLPIVCFEKASGISALLEEHGLRDSCVADYIDTHDMAFKAIRMIDDAEKSTLSASMKEIGEQIFSMPKYIERLMSVKNLALEKFTKTKIDVESIIQAKQFDLTYYLGDSIHNFAEAAEKEYCTEYLLSTERGATYRKPGRAFNPLAYRESLDLPNSVDPLLHRVKHPEDLEYRPPNLITPSEKLLNTDENPMRVALQIHVHYPELLEDIIKRVLSNESKADLFISLSPEVSRQHVERILGAHQVEKASISVHPNVGRDVFPFLNTCKSILINYDLIGHVHTKKSPHAAHMPNLVARWRNLLLGNLLGSEAEKRMMDRIISHMATHPEIQITFPDDPYIEGWGENSSLAKELITEERFSGLPKHFDFPIGTMFWARSSYLQQFVDMEIPARFSPTEPLAIDGTVLHACERLFGALASTQPPQYALTSVQGITR